MAPAISCQIENMDILQLRNVHNDASNLSREKNQWSFSQVVDEVRRTTDHGEDGDGTVRSDSSDDFSIEDRSITLEDMLAKELFGKRHCLHTPTREAKRGFGTRGRLKEGGSVKPLPKVSSSSDLLSEELMSEEAAHASFQRFMERKSRSMENLTDDIPQRPPRQKIDVPRDSGVKNPDEYFRSLLAKRGIRYRSIPGSVLADQGFFVEMKDQNFADYTDEIAFAARKGDMTALRSHFVSGKTAQCCNRHRESIIHTICRKGHYDMLEYILDVTGASIRICCDQFRTPLHDAAWTHRPNFEMIKLIVTTCPDLLYVEDNRGHTPLAYVATPQYEEWCKFLEENVDILKPTMI